MALPDQSPPAASSSKRKKRRWEPGDPREEARPTDWLRVALPVVAVAIFIVIAWRHGYFDLKNPQKLDAAAQRVQDIPWLSPIFIAVYAGLAAFAAPVSPLAYGAGAVFGLYQGPNAAGPALLSWPHNSSCPYLGM